MESHGFGSPDRFNGPRQAPQDIVQRWPQSSLAALKSFDLLPIDLFPKFEASTQPSGTFIH